MFGWLPLLQRNPHREDERSGLSSPPPPPHPASLHPLARSRTGAERGPGTQTAKCKAWKGLCRASGFKPVFYRSKSDRSNWPKITPPAEWPGAPGAGVSQAGSEPQPYPVLSVRHGANCQTSRSSRSFICKMRLTLSPLRML